MTANYLKAMTELGSFEKSIGEMLKNKVEKFGKRNAILEKRNDNFVKLTWDDLYTKIKQIGQGLISMGVKKGDKIAALSNDCNEILALELACMSIGSVFVPFFLGYYPKQIEYVISHSDPKFLIVSDEKQIQKVLSTMATGSIEKYFMIDYDEKYFESTRIFDFNLLYKKQDNYDEFYNRIKEVNGEDLCLLIYTSGGATGISKGVQLTHKNLLGQQEALSQILYIDENDVILSYFLWHQTLGITEKFSALYSGACLALDRTPGINTDSLKGTLDECKPTIYFGSSKIYDELVFEMHEDKELEEKFFHGNVKFAFSSSKLTKRTLDFFIKKNVLLQQGWGLTETLQYVTINTNETWKENCSGYPIPGTEIKLEGEENLIHVRGINVMKAYYKDPERTEACFDKDNWFKTDDAGEINENGLKILGRVESILLLENGKKVYASMIEQDIENSSPFISNCVVFGDQKPFLGALIFPSIITLKSWYESKNGYWIPLADALDEEEVIQIYKKEMENINKALDNIKINAFTLIENELTVKRGELTSSMAPVRKKVLENYNNLVNSFYKKEEELPIELRGRVIRL